MSVAGEVRRRTEPAPALEQLTRWEMTVRPAGDEAGDGEWLAATVPGTAAAALYAAGRSAPDLDDRDVWFRTRFALDPVGAPERVVLGFDGLATLAEVRLNGVSVLSSDSMFTAHEVDVTEHVRAENELTVVCRALTPHLAAPRRPRARWRTRLVAERNLRFVRTMVLGRAPGFADGPAVVGPWRPVWLARRSAAPVHDVTLRTALNGTRGTVTFAARYAGADPLRLTLAGPDGDRHSVPVALDGAGSATAQLTLDAPARWWPHTHGTPALYTASLEVGDAPVLALGRVGFRTLESPSDVARHGIALCVNGVSVFARGAVWTPDLLHPHGTEATLRPRLEALRDAGMNMVRIPGIATWESDAFHDLCDELGILVWQDFMFANLDYPDRDPEFMAAVAHEVGAQLRSLGRHPSLAVLCGGSEVAQQAAMTGVDPLPAMTPLYLQALPALIAAADIAVPYVPSTPWGGDQPFRPSRGVANYYGVGAYLRPLADARAAQVRFAGESLAFANVPDEDALAPSVVHAPEWKRGVPRDVGAGWDFDDVRDHYLGLLYGVDPVALRSSDPERYLALSRQCTGEVMAEVMGEWRRAGSPCAGALILWLADLVPGAGWGVLDHRGVPKVAYHHLRRALAPVAVWSTDEGLDGVVAHVANDGPTALAVTLRVALYRDRETLVEETVHELCLAPHTVEAHNIEAMLGRFVDAAWAYRFGPPGQDLIVLSLEAGRGPDAALISQATRHPVGRPDTVETAATLGLSAHVEVVASGQARLTLSARRYVHGVRVHVPGYRADDDAFALEPGRPRALILRAACPDAESPRGHVSALNLRGHVPVLA